MRIDRSTRLWRVMLGIMVVWLPLGACVAHAVQASYIQLNRGHGEMSVGEWSADILQMQSVGIDTLIVQWSAENGVAYFRADGLPYPEQYDVLERLFAALRGSGMQVFLGLRHENHYWVQIQGRDRVVHDYMRLRVSQNEALQRALLSRFDEEPAWVGYYIPDEVDDLTWREMPRRQYLQQYLSMMGMRIRAHDAARRIGISAFFRVRSAPSVFADLLSECVSGSAIDCVMIQDGAGENDPPVEYLPLYLEALSDACTEGRLPALWYVVEAFRRTSLPSEPFAAEPAPPDRFVQQLRLAPKGVEGLVLFTFPDYVDPDRSEGARLLYKTLVDRSDVWTLPAPNAVTE